MDKKDFGAWAEGLVAARLEAQGWRILERNVHFREGELDIVAERDGVVAFVEVKGRRSERFGGVVEALTTEKLRRLRRAVLRWRMTREDSRPGEIWFFGVMMRGGEVEVEGFLVE